MSTVRTMDDAFARLLDADTHADRVNPALRINAPLPPGPTLVPIARYTDRRYHELEKDKLWGRCWQVAAHEDDFPSVGDVVPYDIATRSFLVVRTGEDEYKAYYNSCLHRGRKLRELRARGLTELRCPFHGWTWNLDGTIKQIPCAYDYADLERDAESLPEVRLERWGRFLFVNPDPNAEPLADYLGDLGQHFVVPYDRLYKQAHVAKVIRANWKVVQEAFMESYHVLMTHPQILTGGAHDMCTKYDAFGNYSRAVRCGALEGEGLPMFEADPHENGATYVRHPLNGWTYERVAPDVVRVTTNRGVTGLFTAAAQWLEGDLKDANAHLCLWVGGEQLADGSAAASPRPKGGPSLAAAAREKLGPDASPNALRAEVQRQLLAGVIPSIAPTIPDVELYASIFLTVFPNWHPWGSFNLINYRFRPNGDNHEECIMECMYLAPMPESGDYTAASEIHWLSVDDDWTQAPELGMLAKVFNQDLRNLPHVYDGLKASGRDHVRLADYNELKLRHFHQMYGDVVGD